MKFVVFLLLVGSAFAVEPSKLSPEVVDALRERKSIDVVIQMAARADPLQLTSRLRFETKHSRRQFVRDSLTQIATESQKDVVKILEERNAVYKSYWISNTIFVRDADHFLLVDQLSSRLDILSISLPVVVPLHLPISSSPILSNISSGEDVQWGVKKIGADRVWAGGNKGEGVVVANIDTGVRWTHEALRTTYRGAAQRNGGEAVHNYNWFAPASKSKEPADGNGHGTHTMGTIAGTHGVGVAPGSTWIACRGCELFGCSQEDLTACAEFLTCPTDTDGNNPDCSKAPDVINNSWGGGQGRDWFDSLLSAWLAAEIVPIFSMGNSGPNCGTANSPGDSPLTTAVGATDSEDVLAKFSSRGPSVNGGTQRIKPEISAPGVNVHSAWHTADDAYKAISGTSMAAPHVTGGVALLLAIDSKATAVQIQSTMENTADTTLPKPTSGEATCGGTEYTAVPNFLYGYGRLNICQAVAKHGGSCN